MHVADNESPGLERAWYAVAMSTEVTDRPTSVKVLGRDWVLVRLADGLAAFEDRCPHRLAPLSIGTVCGTTLRCGYHGWELERSGQCVRIPALGDDAAIPSQARAATPAALQERYGLVWLAPEAPVCEIPEFPEWDDPSFDQCWNEPRRTSAGAIQLTDNFLDATHLPFVHTTTFGVAEDAFLPAHEVERDGWRASTTYVTPYRNHDDPLVATGEHPLVQEHHLFKEFAAATTALVRLTFPLTGGVISILFSCLPEDGSSSRVFKMMARNDFGGDQDKLADSIQFEDRVLDEDLAVLESYRHTHVPLDPRVEVHTRNDKLGLAYRRVLAELVAP
jgi:phenylpropionate dioxygenase-like ring-hydroxylating dioxygenase large terminal subunit